MRRRELISALALPALAAAAFAAELPRLSIRDAAVTEYRDSAVFAVTLSEPGTEPVTVDFTTADGTATSVAAIESSNTDPIDIPEVGDAVPYPHTVNVHGSAGRMTKLTVTLTGFTHTSTSDVDILIVGPGGQRIVLMSDVGAGFAANGLNLTFDDAAPTAIPAGPFGSGTYRPTNLDDGVGNDVWGAPAPEGPYRHLLSDFVGAAMNGVWQLYVVDDTASGSGTISGGWTLHIDRENAADYTATSGTVTFAPGSVIEAINIPIVQDFLAEPEETFSVHLSNPSNATIVDGLAEGRIADVDTVFLRPRHAYGVGNQKYVRVAWNTTAPESRVYRSSDGVTFAHIGTVTQRDPWGNYVFNDSAVQWDTSYLYKIRSVAGGVETAETDALLATVAWRTDTWGRFIELLPFLEASLSVNAVRRLAGLPPMTYSGEPPAVGGVVRAQHLIDLRFALEEARVWLGLPRGNYHNQQVVAGVTPIRYAHLWDFVSVSNCGGMYPTRHPCSPPPRD